MAARRGGVVACGHASVVSCYPAAPLLSGCVLDELGVVI